MILAIDPGTMEARRREKLRAKYARYRARNRERLAAASSARRKADLSKAAARMRDYRTRKPEVLEAIEARRVRPNDYRAQFNAYRKEWRTKNPEKTSEYAHKRDGKRVGKLPPGTIQAIGERQKWRCAACGCSLRKAYHKDHVMPLALGGQHSPENIQLLCPPCNLSKGSKHPIEFMQRRGMLL